MLTITPKELSLVLDSSPEEIDLIDVRWVSEYREVSIPRVRLIPLPTLPLKISKLDKTKKIIFICKSGGRSGQACEYVLEEWITAYNLVWGMIDFEKEFPMKVVHGEI
jgi:rhodanese-related sulfurtransferase